MKKLIIFLSLILVAGLSVFLLILATLKIAVNGLEDEKLCE